MLFLQATKNVAAAPGDFTAGASASLVVDTLLYNEGKFIVNLGVLTSPTNVPTVLQLLESDNTYSSNYVTIANSSQVTNVTQVNTSGSYVVEWDLSLNNGTRKRYIEVYTTVAVSQYVDIHADLGRPEIFPVTAADKNVQTLITI